MPTKFSYSYMPMYSHDQAAYMRQMHDWHNQMAQYNEQKRLHHLEMARHFNQMIGGREKEPAIFIKEEVKTTKEEAKTA